MNGTITKRPLGKGRFSWGYCFDAGKDSGGKRRQITKSGLSTKAAASDALREAIKRNQAGASAGKHKGTFAEFFEQWMKEYVLRKCAPKTAERYEQLGQYAVAKFGGMRLQDLQAKPMVIEQALNELLDNGGRVDKSHPKGRSLSARTVRHIAFTINGAFKKAIKWRLIETNPMSGVDLPKAEKKEAEVLDRDKIDTLLNAASGTRLFPLLVLAVATGARRGELLCLQWPDIDFETGIMSVSKSLEETKAGLRVKSTKSGKPRKFVVPASALAVLEEHRKEQNQDKELYGADYEDNNLVFCRPEGTYYKPDKISVRVTELTGKVGLTGAKLHTLRHSHASELLSKRVPLPAVSKRLGHANPGITLAIYSHALEADEVAAAKTWDDAMAEVISGSSKKRQPARMLGNVSPKAPVIELKPTKQTA